VRNQTERQQARRVSNILKEQEVKANYSDPKYIAQIDSQIPIADEIATSTIDRKIYNTPEKYADKYNQVFHREMARLCHELGIRKSLRFMED